VRVDVLFRKKNYKKIEKIFAKSGLKRYLQKNGLKRYLQKNGFKRSLQKVWIKNMFAKSLD
jgi:hypothetical protein